MTKTNISGSWRWVAVVALLAATLLPRLISLGSILTIDEPLWQSRGDTFIRAFSVGNFSRTLVAGQPGVTTAWLVGLADFADSLAADQAAIALMSSVLVLFITYFAVRLWGFTWGIVAGFFLALDPYLIAHSRLAHTDALLALFYLASLLSFLAAILPTSLNKRIVWRYVVASAVFGALALLTKMFALILLPTIFVIGAVTAYRARFSWQLTVKIFALWAGSFVLAVYMLWPALWTNALGVYEYLFERVAIHSEGTRSGELTSEWWYYGRVEAFRLTVIASILLPFSVFGVLRHRKSGQWQAGMWLFVAAFAYVAALSLSADKGGRYILFSLITITLCSTFGWRVLIQWSEKKFPLYTNRIFVASVVGVLAFLAADVIRLHPYYLVHYNRLYPVQETHKLGWGEGLEQAAVWLSENTANASVASYYPRVLDYFYDGSVAPYNHAEGKDYLVLYRSMMERGPDHPDTEAIQEYVYSGAHTPAKVITINGLPYVWIFELK